MNIKKYKEMIKDIHNKYKKRIGETKMVNELPEDVNNFYKRTIGEDKMEQIKKKMAEFLVSDVPNRYRKKIGEEKVVNNNSAPEVKEDVYNLYKSVIGEDLTDFVFPNVPNHYKKTISEKKVVNNNLDPEVKEDVYNLYKSIIGEDLTDFVFPNVPNHYKKTISEEKIEKMVKETDFFKLNELLCIPKGFMGLGASFQKNSENKRKEMLLTFKYACLYENIDILNYLFSNNNFYYNVKNNDIVNETNILNYSVENKKFKLLDCLIKNDPLLMMKY